MSYWGKYRAKVVGPGGTVQVKLSGAANDATHFAVCTNGA